MKAFIFSLSIIIVITAFTVASGLYVKSVTDQLLALEKRFPEKDRKTARRRLLIRPWGSQGKDADT